MGSGGAGKGKSARPTEEKKHANDINATRKSQGKPTKSVASVSRSKARSQAYHARISQPVPGECIGAPAQVPPEPPAAPSREPRVRFSPLHSLKTYRSPGVRISPNLLRSRRQQGLC